MSDPAWQPFAIQDGVNFTFPSFQEFSHGGSNQSQIVCPEEAAGGWQYFEITVTSAPGSQYCLGIMAASIAVAATPNIRVNFNSQGSCSWIAENGAVFTNAGSVASMGATPTGTVVGVLVNTTSSWVAFTLNGTDWNGGSGNTAAILAGTGVINWGYAGPVVPFVSISGASGSFTIAASIAHCTHSLPAGATYLPANSALTLASIASQNGAAAQLNWTAGNVNTSGGLQYRLDGGAWIACTGVVTGASGTAIGPTISDYNIHTLALRETAAPLDQTATIIFTPVVAGTLLAEATYETTSFGSSSDTIVFASNAPTIVFAGVITNANSLGLSGVNSISFLDNGGTVAWSATADTQGGPPATETVVSVTGQSGFATISGINTTTPITGTLTMTGGGNYAYDITCNGTNVTGTEFVAGTTTSFGTMVLAVAGTATPNLIGASAAIPASMETLVLTSAACCAGGILDIGAEVFSGAPANVDIGVNGTYATAASYTLTSGTITATDGTLAAGTYAITIRDTADPTVISNSLPLVVSGESLTLTSLSGSFGTVLVADGLSNGGPPTDVDISTDGGSTWVEATSFTNTGMGSVNNPFIAVGGTISTTGTLDVLVRDHAFPDCVISNGLDLVVGEESILLTVASGSLGSTLSLAGTLYEAFPAALDVTLDDGSTWQDVSSYSHGAMLPAAFISSLTTSLAVGTYTIAVRDAVFTDIVSNFLVLVISAGGLVCAVPPAQPNLGRYRGAVGINWNGMTLIGDAFAGVVGQADFDSFTEYGNTMLGLITTPPLNDDRLRVFVSRFELDVESGIGAPDCCGANPNWMLDWSKDGGRTFGPQQLLRSAGRIGHYLQRLRWLRLGQARQWIFRLQCTDPVRRVIIGVSVDTHSGMR